MRKATPWIELSVLLIALTTIVWSGFDEPSQVDHNRAASAALTVQVSGLHQQLESLLDKASHYLENSPREYDAYFRDTEITDHYLRSDLDAMTGNVEVLTSLLDARDPARNASMHPDEELISALPLEDLDRAWGTFIAGLNEQLGVDPDMPRLEWGAQHIVDEIRPVMTALESTQLALTSPSPESTDMTTPAGTATWAWPALAAWVLLMLVWFGARARRSTD